MRSKVQEAYDEEKVILWLDETVFTKAANVTHSWSKKNQNIKVPAELMGFKYVAALATISFGRGFEYYELLDGAVNEEIFANFLVNLADFYENEDIVIVMDNLHAHTNPNNKQLMDELGIEYIYNVPYSPDYNAIETAFAQVKRVFK